MKRVYYILLCLVAVSLSSLGAQEITRVEQVGKMIEIDYQFTKSTALVLLLVSQDGGKTFSAPLKEVSFKNGTVTWNPIAEYGGLVGKNISFKVIATPSPFTGMIYVEGGTFEMGSGIDEYNYNIENQTYSVTLSSFYISKHEVTQAEWESVMGSNPSKFKGSNKPVERVSWFDCILFCNAKSSKEGKEVCYQIEGEMVTLLAEKKGYRLPTEAEWEYAARGGNRSNGYTYAGSNSIDSVAWYRDNANNSTHDVGTKQCNELGIYDMTGNVWEWCWDWHSSYVDYSLSDPTGAVIGTIRTLRGGSWYYDAKNCRVSTCNGNSPSHKNGGYGIRIVLAL